MLLSSLTFVRTWKGSAPIRARHVVFGKIFVIYHFMGEVG